MIPVQVTVIILEEEVAAIPIWHFFELVPNPPAGVKVPPGLDDTATILGVLYVVGQAKSSQQNMVIQNVLISYKSYPGQSVKITGRDCSGFGWRIALSAS